MAQLGARPVHADEGRLGRPALVRPISVQPQERHEQGRCRRLAVDHDVAGVVPKQVRKRTS